MRNISEWLESNGIAAETLAEGERWRRSAENSWYRPSGTPKDPGIQTAAGARRGRPLVTAGRVIGVMVYDSLGERLGRVFDVAIEKSTGRVAHVLVGTRGFPGFMRRFYPLPWRLFSYAQELRGYRLTIRRADLQATPGLRRDELDPYGGGCRSAFDDPCRNAFLDLPAA